MTMKEQELYFSLMSKVWIIKKKKKNKTRKDLIMRIDDDIEATYSG